MSKIFLTGDCHGTWTRLGTRFFPQQKDLTKDDYVIILGDFGIWNKTNDEDWWFDWLDEKPFTTLFLDGNHENFDRLYSDEFETIDFKGGKAQVIRPSVLHLCRGYVFDIDNTKLFVFGGASSHDISDGILEPDNYANKRELKKDFNYRYNTLNQDIRINHISWWKEELPSEEEMTQGMNSLNNVNNKVDFVLSHCLPTEFAKLWGREDILTDYFQKLKDNGLEYKHWYSGHYHCNKDLTDKDHILYGDIIQIK